jgi:hypothetical protein
LNKDTRSAISTLTTRFFQSVLPSRKDVLTSVRLFGYILFGGILLYPLFSRLPLLGWDWYFFFTAHHPTDNIYNPGNPFFPYTKYFIQLLTWMYWRDSLAILGGITYMAIALGTWAAGGKYGSIALALLNPLPLFLLWVGHPDGLALTGMLVGFIPLALIKPQITFWSFLRSKAQMFWVFLFLGLVILIWPNWMHGTFGSTWDHSASFGWQALGWPVLVLGFILLLGAGNDPWRLMAAGCFITPDLMPYHVIVLLPAIGKVQGKWKAVVWFCTWLVFVGTGAGGNVRFINLLLPLSIYLALQTPQLYKETVMSYISILRLWGRRLAQRDLSIN